MIKKHLTILSTKEVENNGQLLIRHEISAGFQSPANDYKEIRISHNKELIKNKETTFYARVDGDSMIGAELNHGDLIIVDRSLNLENGK